ncbi:hypothetical protein ACPW7J_10430 [Ihubacter sp. rT4E-8]|uniref:hypothetical protein n=1 Tax=Ihubacter sp. rT4E-8 TaxID=3242369 RepID=UPI003CE9B71A
MDSFSGIDRFAQNWYIVFEKEKFYLQERGERIVSRLYHQYQIMRRAMKREMREHRSSFIVFSVLRALVVLVMVLQALNHNYENVLLCALTLLLMLLPSFVQLELRVELPKTLEIIILVFIFAAEILGEIRAFYVRVPLWDTMLHTVTGFLAAAVGFSLVDLLNRSKRQTFQLSPVYLAMTAFCFSMTIGVLWEFFEFAMDQVFSMDMQKDTVIHEIHSVLLNPQGRNARVTIDGIERVIVNGRDLGVDGYLDIGLIDTMKDLFVNFIGAACFSVFGYFYVKSRGKNKIAGNLIPELKKEENDFLTQEEQREDL